jgi:ribonuclease HII
VALVYHLKEEFASYELMAGIDEAGRGPWAGPVVAAAVIFKKGYYNDAIDDSKKLTAHKRDQLFDIIVKDSLSIGIGIVSAEVIDKINILQATKLAMRKAIDNLSIKPAFLLIDALKLDGVALPQLGLIHGDALALPIAAASIIAKVTRDRIMVKIHHEHPIYRFDLHKGYGTKLHHNMILTHGAIKGIHRMSFRPIKNL